MRARYPLSPHAGGRGVGSSLDVVVDATRRPVPRRRVCLALSPPAHLPVPPARRQAMRIRVADTTFDISRVCLVYVSCVVMCTAPYSCSLESLVLSVSSHGDGRKNICSMETCSEHAMVYTHMDDGHAGAQADFVFRVKAVKPPAATHHTQTDRWRRASPSARAPSSVGGPATRRAA